MMTITPRKLTRTLPRLSRARGRLRPRPQPTLDAHRAPVAPERAEHACYVSTLRVGLEPATANEAETLFAAHSMPEWRDLQARGELHSVTLVPCAAWAHADHSAHQFDLVTQWADKDAYDRNRDRFTAQVYGLAVACYTAARFLYP